MKIRNTKESAVLLVVSSGVVPGPLGDTQIDGCSVVLYKMVCCISSAGDHPEGMDQEEEGWERAGMGNTWPL